MGREGGPSDKDMGIKPEATKVQEAGGKFSWNTRDREMMQQQIAKEAQDALVRVQNQMDAARPLPGRGGISSSSERRTIGEAIQFLEEEIEKARALLVLSENAEVSGQKIYGYNPKDVIPQHRKDIARLGDTLVQLQRSPDKSRTIGEMIRELTAGQNKT